MAPNPHIGRSHSFGLPREPNPRLARLFSSKKLGNITRYVGSSSFRCVRFFSGPTGCHSRPAMGRGQFDLEGHYGCTLLPYNHSRVFNHERGQGTSLVEFIDDDPPLFGFGNL